MRYLLSKYCLLMLILDAGISNDHDNSLPDLSVDQHLHGVTLLQWNYLTDSRITFHNFLFTIDFPLEVNHFIDDILDISLDEGYLVSLSQLVNVLNVVLYYEFFILSMQFQLYVLGCFENHGVYQFGEEVYDAVQETCFVWLQQLSLME